LDLSQKDMPMLDTYRFGRFEVRPRERQLLVGDEPAPLGARAFDVLMALIERRERVVAKNELLDLVWPGLVVEENNLQVQVSSLRKLVGPQAIATIPGRGYRFTAALDVPAAERPGCRCCAPYATRRRAGLRYPRRIRRRSAICRPPRLG
jgi:DNA-binding winged helix-turn-helix (wHTH) protein